MPRDAGSVAIPRDASATLSVTDGSRGMAPQPGSVIQRVTDHRVCLCGCGAAFPTGSRGRKFSSDACRTKYHRGRLLNSDHDLRVAIYRWRLKHGKYGTMGDLSRAADDHMRQHPDLVEEVKTALATERDR